MRELRTAITVAAVFTLLLGLAYPLAMTGASQVAFPGTADGDRTLIGRDFSKDDSLFQSRPSATGYSTTATFFNNQGPNQKALVGQLRRAVKAYLRREGPFTPGLTAARIPSDAVTTSASGVDPHISLANARIQAHRVAARRGIALPRVLALVGDGRSVNVAELNAAVTKEGE